MHEKYRIFSWYVVQRKKHCLFLQKTTLYNILCIKQNFTAQENLSSIKSQSKQQKMSIIQNGHHPTRLHFATTNRTARVAVGRGQQTSPAEHVTTKRRGWGVLLVQTKLAPERRQVRHPGHRNQRQGANVVIVVVIEICRRPAFQAIRRQNLHQPRHCRPANVKDGNVAQVLEHGQGFSVTGTAWPQRQVPDVGQSFGHGVIVAENVKQCQVEAVEKSAAVAFQKLQKLQPVMRICIWQRRTGIFVLQTTRELHQQLVQQFFVKIHGNGVEKHGDKASQV